MDFWEDDINDRYRFRRRLRTSHWAQGNEGGQCLFDKNAPQRGTLEFVYYAKTCDYHLPSYWTIRHSSIDRNPPLIKAGERSSEAIKNLIAQTWDSDQAGQGRDASGLSKCDIEVGGCAEARECGVIQQYFQERQKLFDECSKRRTICRDIQKLPGSEGRTLTANTLPSFMKGELYWEVNEHYLFHGTKAENINSILTTGLDPSYCKRTMLGKAVYVAESFTKSHQYTDSLQAHSNPGTVMYMILARVLLGRVYVCDDKDKTHQVQGPPCTSCEKNDCQCPSPHSRYDSVMADGVWTFREFAVYQKNRCYPEYVITYRRKQESQSSSSLYSSQILSLSSLPLSFSSPSLSTSSPRLTVQPTPSPRSFSLDLDSYSDSYYERSCCRSCVLL